MEQVKKSHSIDMLNGPLLKNILLFSLPIAASSILQQLFNSADTAIAGRFGDPDALAAVGTNGEIVSFVVSVSSGLAVGANVLIAHYIGSGRREKISSAVHTSMLFSIIAGIIFALIGQFVSAPLLTLINTPEDILDSAVGYLRMYFAGVPFLMIYDFGAAVLRSKGDSRRPLNALMLSGVINVLLNLFFVIVMKLNVLGVALATDISTAFSAALVVYWLFKEQEDFCIKLSKLKIEGAQLKKILIIGVPAAVQNAVFCIANIFLQSAINTFGSTAAAGSAVSMNYEYIAYYVNSAFGQAAATFTGQNYAAGKWKRCKKIFLICMAEALFAALLLCIGFVAFRYQASALFTSSAAEIEYSCERLLTVLLLQPLCTLYEIPAWTMRGMGYSSVPAAENMICICVVRIIWRFTVFEHFRTLRTLYIVFPFTWVITTVVAAVTFIIVCRMAYKKLPAVSE